MYELKFISKDESKNMANGMRNISREPLTEEEILQVQIEIKRIQADASKFVFNDSGHISKSTCYNYLDDVVYVTKNVFPDVKYGSTHPRDIMSIAAVLSHEYYGHRIFRDEYLSDEKRGESYHTTPFWQDECRASITAAKITPNLSQMERSHLILDAIYRAQEFGQWIQMDDFMKEVLYGYPTDGSRNISSLSPIIYISEQSDGRRICGRESQDTLPQMQDAAEDFDEPER